MVVIRQDFSDAFPVASPASGNAIGEAVLLISSGFEKAQAVQEGLIRLGVNDDDGIGQDVPDKGRDCLTNVTPFLTKVRQHFKRALPGS